MGGEGYGTRGLGNHETHLTRGARRGRHLDARERGAERGAAGLARLGEPPRRREQQRAQQLALRGVPEGRG